MEQLPVLNEYSAEDKTIAELQAGFAARLRKSAYYIIEQTKSNGTYVLPSPFCLAEHVV
jgi:DNA-directed RNA polymerase III subunit RPC7